MVVPSCLNVSAVKYLKSPENSPWRYSVVYRYSLYSLSRHLVYWLIWSSEKSPISTGSSPWKASKIRLRFFINKGVAMVIDEI